MLRPTARRASVAVSLRTAALLRRPATRLVPANQWPAGLVTKGIGLHTGHHSRGGARYPRAPAREDTRAGSQSNQGPVDVSLRSDLVGVNSELGLCEAVEGTVLAPGWPWTSARIAVPFRCSEVEVEPS